MSSRVSINDMYVQYNSEHGRSSPHSNLFYFSRPVPLTHLPSFEGSAAMTRIRCPSRLGRGHLRKCELETIALRNYVAFIYCV